MHPKNGRLLVDKQTAVKETRANMYATIIDRRFASLTLGIAADFISPLETVGHCGAKKAYIWNRVSKFIFLAAMSEMFISIKSVTLEKYKIYLYLIYVYIVEISCRLFKLTYFIC